MVTIWLNIQRTKLPLLIGRNTSVLLFSCSNGTAEVNQVCSCV